ncbi:glycoside hydrolase family 20 zincin-like fold domain-containing protein [Actinotalea sp. AC32]|nr:glycoside hydrolase family 20 zincin-like fold domain-containing protein [Actinotalea sp. AC32]
MDPLGALPAPFAVTQHAGRGFAIGADVEVTVDDDPAAVGVAVLLAEQLGRVTGTPVAVRQDGVRTGTICLRLVPAAQLALPGVEDGAPTAEAYRLAVGATSVEVLAAGPAGLGHAVSTLVQAVERRLPGPVVLPAVTVVDRPRLAHRGVVVDAVRDGLGPERLKSVVQVAAGLKLDVVRVRLADAGTWLLEVPGRPGLAAVGTPWTQEAWRDLLAYAAARCVRVVPELDVADHAGWAGPDALGAVATQMRGGHVHVGGALAPGADPDVTRALVGMAADEVVAAGATVMVHEDTADALADGRAPGHVVEVRARTSDAAVGGARTGRIDPGAHLVVVLDAPHATSPSDPSLRGLVAHDLLARSAWPAPVGASGGTSGRVVGAELALDARAVDGGLTYGSLAGLAAAAEAFWSVPGAAVDSFPGRLAAEVERWAAAAPLG